MLINVLPFLMTPKSTNLVKTLPNFHEIHNISQDVIKFNSRISLWILLCVSFADFIMNFITDFTGMESTVKSIMKYC